MELTDDQYRYHSQAKATRAQLGGVRWPTPREISDWLREAQHDVLLAQNAADSLTAPGEYLAQLYEYQMGLARARYLNGDPTKVVRNELSAAARHIETLFCDAFPLQNKTEVRALEGIMTALMVNDLDTARRISNTVHAGLSDAAAGEIPFEDRHHFLQALTHYLDGQRYEALESLQQSTRRYRTQCLSRMDTRTYYFTLHTALRGIVEGDANAFNTGLAAHL